MTRATCLLVLSFCAAAEPTIVIVGGPHLLWPQIVNQYRERHPAQNVSWKFDPQDADLVFAYYPTQSELEGTLRMEAKRWLGFPFEFVSASWKRAVDQESSAKASAYLDEGGVKNGVRLLEYLYSLVRQDGVKPQPPLPGPQSGIYHPAAPDLFHDLKSYRDWRNPAKDSRIVAISFFGTWIRGRDLALVDALIARVESAGYFPVAVFGYPLEKVTPLLEDEGKFQPAAVIALNGSLSSPKDPAVYESWRVPVFNGLVTRESAEQWRSNPKGLPGDRVAAQLSFPERSGMIAPTLVATTETAANGIKTTQPFSEGVDALVRRMERAVALRTKPNEEKRVALIYYDNPAGKGNIGASYLQVFPSIRNILESLASEGYRVAQPLPDGDTLHRLMEANGRNVELWAEGEKQRMAHSAGVVRWPISEYRRFYDRLPEAFRESVEEIWGPPESSRLMTSDGCFLLPAHIDQNIVIAPQPLRTTFAQASDPSHEKLVAPPHQYIAFYFWLREVWKADALVHIGRHGTLEWLPGKQTAMSPEDAPEVLLGDIPNFNLYVMDGGGEAIQAKRRGLATLISHLTPMIWRAGGRADLEKLHESFHALTDQGDTLSPALAAEHERITRSEVKRLGLDRQLQLDMNADLKQIASTLHRFLHDIEDAPLPAGLPVFGQAPSDAQLREAVCAYLFAAFPRAMHDDVELKIPVWPDSILAGDTLDLTDLPERITTPLTRAAKNLPAWIQSLRDAGAAERNGLLTALRGEFLPSHLLGDPLRKPEALPTGANLHAVDSARIPTEAAWTVGRKMADDFIDRYREAHGEVPKRASLVLWYGETERHQGAMESMAMALLGVRPVWNPQGIVDHLELMSKDELGRDRIDVVFTISGNYRDGFPDKVQLLDKAVRLAAQADDGVIAANDRAAAAAIEAKGADAVTAERLSRLRVFSAKPGAYGVGVQYLVEKSGGGDTAPKIASLYASNMGFGYSADQWGVASDTAFAAQLKSVDAVQFSRSSNLYGSLDNDDTYQWVGGLRTAVQQFAKRAPDVYLHNLRKAGSEKAVTLREWLAVELHSRQFNPKWIEGMRDSGYAGAREMTKEIEHLYGFQKTTPDHLSPQTWQTVMDVFVKDKYKLGLKKFFNRENPHARQTMLARLIEVDRQGIHRFNPADRQMLVAEFAKSVASDHPACNAQVCGNVRLRSYVTQQLRTDPNASAKLDQAFRAALQSNPAEKHPLTSTRANPLRRPLPLIRIVRQLPAKLKAVPIPARVSMGLAAAYLVLAAIASKRRRRTVIALDV